MLRCHAILFLKCVQMYGITIYCVTVLSDMKHPILQGSFIKTGTELKLELQKAPKIDDFHQAPPSSRVYKQ